MENIHRWGRIQKRLLVIVVFIIFLVFLLVSMMMQLLGQNEKLMNNFIDDDLKLLEQVVAIDNSVSKISVLAIELNQLGDFSMFRKKNSELAQEINNLRDINSQYQLDNIDESFINNLLVSSQNILEQGNNVITSTADIQAVLFKLDTEIQANPNDPYYDVLSNLYHQLFALREQNNSFSLNVIRNQLQQIAPMASPLTKKTYPLFEQDLRLSEQRVGQHDRLTFLSLYFGAQSNETTKIAKQLLDDMWRNNHEQAHKIVSNIHQKRFQLILTSAAIILTIFLLLYMVLGDLGKKLHQLSSALLQLAQGKKLKIDLPYYRKDEIGDLSRSYQIFENHLVDLAAMSERVSKQNQLMQTVFDTMRDGLSMFDSEGKIVSWNNKYTQILGLDSHMIHQSMPLADIEAYLQNQNVKNISNYGEILNFNAITTERFHQNLSFEKHYPSGRIVELRSSPMMDGGFVTLYLDRTSRRALEQKYQQAQRLEAIGTITNGIAHDFNNFLAVIYGNVELLLEEDMKEEYKTKLNQIKRISLSAQEMIERLLTFSRKESTLSTIFSANNMLENIYQIMEPLLKDSQITLSLELDAADLYIKANLVEIEAAILNLISNSQKAIKDSGNIILKSRYKNGNVELSVQDDGIGMDNETIKHIFEPFYSQEINDIQGTGLGLSMAYGAVKRAKGDIIASSESNQGCIITLILPSYPKPKEQLNSAVNNQPKKEHQIILLVDDNADVRHILRAQLQKMGHIVLDAQNGVQAVEYLKKSEDIQLVISDVMMPKMDGIELADYINNHCAHIPIILFSGNRNRKMEAYHALSPKPPLISKPWKIEEIQKLIAALS